MTSNNKASLEAIKKILVENKDNQNIYRIDGKPVADEWGNLLKSENDYSALSQKKSFLLYTPRDCPRCGKEFLSEYISLVGHPFANCCPSCVDEQGRQEERERDARKKKQLAEIYRKNGIPAEFAEKTLADYMPENQSEAEALEAAQEILDGKIKKLLLLGTNGVGKTMLACCIAKEMRGVVIRASMLFMKRREALNYKSRLTESQLLENFSQAKVLCIDEIRSISPDELAFLSNVIDIRHSNGLPTVLVSNAIRKTDCIGYSNEKSLALCASCTRHECIESQLSNEIISRLKENSRIVCVKGRDRRKAQ